MPTYRVTCCQSATFHIGFEVEASSPQEAIDFCANRADADGNFITPCEDNQIETESEYDWKAKALPPIDDEPQPQGPNP